jgi:hypothetical protein
MSFDTLFWRPDLSAPDVTMVLAVTPLVERMKGTVLTHCPSTVATALTWRKVTPDTVSLVRRDLLDDNQDSLYGDSPSFYWHDFPVSFLEQAAVAGFDGWLMHPADLDSGWAVAVSPHESAPGWLTISENNQFADGYVGLGLPEPGEEINVALERVIDFLAAVWRTPVPGGSR